MRFVLVITGVFDCGCGELWAGDDAHHDADLSAGAMEEQVNTLLAQLSAAGLEGPPGRPG